MSVYLKSSKTTTCCGHYLIVNWDGPIKEVRSALGAAIYSIEGSQNTCRRVVEAVLNTNQVAKFGPLLKEFGFTLMLAFDNSSGMKCYVFMRLTGGEISLVTKAPVGWKGAPPLYQTREEVTATPIKTSEIPNPFTRNVPIW